MTWTTPLHASMSVTSSSGAPIQSRAEVLNALHSFALPFIHFGLSKIEKREGKRGREMWSCHWYHQDDPRDTSDTHLRSSQIERASRPLLISIRFSPAVQGSIDSIITSPDTAWNKRTSRRKSGFSVKVSMSPGGREKKARFVGANTVQLPLLKSFVSPANPIASHNIVLGQWARASASR